MVMIKGPSSKRARRTPEEILKAFDDGDIEVGVGYPGAPKGLSRDEERRHDERGHPIVTKAPWGDVSTGLWLTVFGSKAPARATGVLGGTFKGTEVGGLRLLLGVSAGRPSFDVAGWGVSLELPADLAQDPLKKSYVMEWLVGSCSEIFQGALSKRAFRGIPDTSLDAFAIWMQTTADAAIRASGL